MCKWKSKYASDYECREDPLPNDPDGYCILHSKKEDKDLKEFHEKVEKRMCATDKIDLRGCYFLKDFPSDYFKRYTFDKPVDFSEATFSQRTYFSRVTFSRADFQEATFSQGVDFFKTTFEKEANFSKTIFQGGKTNFREAKFKGEANFSDTQFKSEEVSFSDTCFIEKGEVKFDNPHFRGQVYFIETKFDKPCKFWWSEFPRTEKQAVFENTDLSKCSFLHSNVDKVDFRYCKFGEKKERLFRIIRQKRQNVLKDELDCEENKIETSERLDNLPQEVKFSNSLKDKIRHDIGKAGNKCLIFRGVMSEEEKCELLKLSSDSEYQKAVEALFNKPNPYELVRRLYLELKKNFEEKKDWNTAGDFHFGEMESRRKMKEGWLRRYIFSLEALYYVLSGYGERPKRAGFWTFFLIVVFALFYMPSADKISPAEQVVHTSAETTSQESAGNTMQGHPATPGLPAEGCSPPEAEACSTFKRYLEGLNTSLRVTARLDTEEKGWPRTIQSILGPILIALFFLALRRKVKR